MKAVTERLAEALRTGFSSMRAVLEPSEFCTQRHKQGFSNTIPSGQVSQADALSLVIILLRARIREEHTFGIEQDDKEA